MSRSLLVALLALACFGAACSEPHCPRAYVRRGGVCRHCPDGSVPKDDDCVALDGGQTVPPIGEQDAQTPDSSVVRDSGLGREDAALGAMDSATFDAQGMVLNDSAVVDADTGAIDTGLGTAVGDAGDGGALADAQPGSPEAGEAGLDSSAFDASAADAAEAAVIPMGDDVVRVLAPFSWLRADSVVISGGKVLSIKDKMSESHVVTQPDMNQQVSQPSAVAALNGQPALTFLGQQWYGSILPATNWSFLHNGQGAETFHVFAPTSASGIQCIVATGKGAIPTTTSTTYLSTNSLSKTIRNGSTTVVQLSAGVLNLNVPVLVREVFASSSSPDFELHFTGGIAASADVQNAPTSDPAGSLRLSGCTDGEYNAAMQWAESIFFARVLSGAERASVRAYIAARYGAAVAGQ